MRITDLRVNHFDEFFGHRSDTLALSWVASGEGKTTAASRVEIASDAGMTDILYDSGWAALDPLCHVPEFEPKPRTRYFWRVSARSDGGDEGISEIKWFETGKRGEKWDAEWITSPYDKDAHFLAAHDFDAENVVKARAYVACHGSYELYLNGEKVGDELLAPGYHSYDFRDMAYAYDLTPMLKGKNRIGAMVSPAWFKGRFGLPGHGSRQYDLYGERMEFLCEIRLTMADGSERVIGSGADWLCHESPVTMSTIYDGEDYDARLECPDWCEFGGADSWSKAVVTNPKSWTTGKSVPIVDRSNAPIRVTERIKPELITTPSGEKLLDFKQMLTGYMEAEVDLPAGAEVSFICAEVLENGEFYRGTMRSARAAFKYISNGKPATIRPHGTFFGFRYLRVEGMDADPSRVTACVMHSDLKRTGWIETSSELVNKLISNTYWGQRDNFLDVPTDCPQRDERMGWTGDTQVFSGTACFNQYAPAFYAKYIEDVACEQSVIDGAVPGYVPVATPKNEPRRFVMCSCGWGDVVTVVPWNVYSAYGDKVQLGRDYPAMKAYVDYLFGLDEADGGKRLWQTGGHTADWLALDNYKNPHAPNGGTDEHYIASAYYAHSSRLVAKAAAALGKTEDAEYYEDLSKQIRASMVREYFSPNGRCVCDTQTAYLIALGFEIVPDSMRPRLIEFLNKKLYEDRYHLQTGFLGTPLLCPTLSENGLNDLAYTILLGEDYPGWLNEIKLGATTQWERWNSVLPDGTVNRNGMSSMNHYAYGAVVEWLYRYVCGLRSATPGWKHARLEPLPNAQLEHARAVYDSASGRWECGWKIDGDEVTYTAVVPFGCTAELVIDGETRALDAGEYTVKKPLSDEIRKVPKELPPPEKKW